MDGVALSGGNARLGDALEGQAVLVALAARNDLGVVLRGEEIQ